MIRESVSTAEGEYSGIINFMLSCSFFNSRPSFMLVLELISVVSHSRCHVARNSDRNDDCLGSTSGPGLKSFSSIAVVVAAAVFIESSDECFGSLWKAHS